GSLYNCWRSEIPGTHLQLSLNLCKRPPFQRLNCSALDNAQNDEDADTANNCIGKIALHRIAEKLRSLEQGDETDDGGFEQGHPSYGRKKIFPNRTKNKIGHSFVRSRSSSKHEEPVFKQGGMEKEEEEKVTSENKKLEFVPTLAQLSISEQGLKRLRTHGKYTTNKLTIGKAGITEAVVNYIHYRWRKSEVVKIKCGGTSPVNMKRIQDILEEKTGGLVVWRAADIIILYRGVNYKHPCAEASPSIGVNLESVDSIQFSSHPNFLNTSVDRVNGNLPVETSSEDKKAHMVNNNTLMDSLNNTEIEVFQKDCFYPCEQKPEINNNILLDGLGPHFTDSLGFDPLPVNANLPLAAAPQYVKPSGLLFPEMKDKLTETEISSLQKLAESLSPHFSLGKNCQPQGLVAAIFELWERSEIAKIEVKHEVQSNISKKIAEDLEGLTGGTLLSSNNEFIVLYRGKDFLCIDAASVLAERKATMFHQKVKMEKLKESPSVHADRELQFSVSGTAARSKGHKKRWKNRVHSEDQKRMQKEPSKAKLSLDDKLTFALLKKVKVENELLAIERGLKCVQLPINQQTITIEERLVLRKIGLRMNAFILLGKPGVFVDVIENMHLHWKYRKLVKIISNEKSFVQVKDLARILEYESGGILVAVDSVEKGYAITVYRGKNYQRPTMLRPDSLLNEKVALRRWNAIQRRESLRLELLRVERDIERLKIHLSKVQDVKEEIIEQLSKEMKSTYPSSSEYEEKNPVQVMNKLDSEYLSKYVEEQHMEAYSDLYDCSNKNEDEHSELQVVKIATNLGTAKISTEGHKNKKEKAANEVYRAEPLSNKDRRLLREQAKKMPKPPQFCVGKKNVVSDLAKSIRSRFKKHALVKVEVKGRARGTSVAEIAFQLEVIADSKAFPAT
ncbi:hypothetical protein KI387_032078, partial [Taxus chinensis]